MVLIILIFGAIGYTNLAVREYPNVDNPIITVQVSYPGANRGGDREPDHRAA